MKLSDEKLKEFGSTYAERIEKANLNVVQIVEKKD